MVMDLDPLDVALPDALSPEIAGLMVDIREPTATSKHDHRRGELLYVISGKLSVETDNGHWIIPSSYAMWIPGGVRHTAHSHGSARAACIFIEGAQRIGLSSSCGMVLVEPLLREVIFKLLAKDTAAMPPERAERAERLVAVMADELAAAPTIDVELPWPQDSKLLKLAELMVFEPSRRIGLGDWAARAGISERTLARMFWRETGMNPSHWRQRLHVRLAMQQLAARRPVGNIAYDLGYESQSAFTAMFKEVTGVTPGRFVARD